MIYPVCPIKFDPPIKEAKMIPELHLSRFFYAAAFFLLCSISLQAAQDRAPIKLGEGTQPQVAVDPSGNIFVTWGVKPKGAKTGQIYSTVSTDGGQTFSKPVTVAAEAPGLALGMRRGPRIAATAKSLVIAAIIQSEPEGKAGEIVAWHSGDQGKNWKLVRNVNTAADSAEEGLHALAAGPENTFLCVWQDRRSGKMEGWGAFSKDGGQTWQSDKLIYKSGESAVCPCCYPTAVFDQKGNISVMFRNDIDGNKDMYLTRSTDGGKTFTLPAKLGTGSWKLQACPMDGGGICAAADGSIITAWRRDRKLFFTQGDITRENPLGTGEQPSVTSGPDGLYAAYVNSRGGPITVVTKDGKNEEKGADPVVAGAADCKGPVVMVWEDAGAIQFRLLAARK
jgi:hypothetical protein